MANAGENLDPETLPNALYFDSAPDCVANDLVCSKFLLAIWERADAIATFPRFKMRFICVVLACFTGEQYHG